MKTKPILSLLGAAALAVGLAAPNRSSGQAGRDDAALSALLTEISAQQNAIAENQIKIDEKFASIAENVRVARIFVSRGGGGGAAAADSSGLKPLPSKP